MAWPKYGDPKERRIIEIGSMRGQERIMREKGLKEKEREAPTHLIELARFTHATKDSSCMR